MHIKAPTGIWYAVLLAPIVSLTTLLWLGNLLMDWMAAVEETLWLSPALVFVYPVLAYGFLTDAWQPSQFE